MSEHSLRHCSGAHMVVTVDPLRTSVAVALDGSRTPGRCRGLAARGFGSGLWPCPRRQARWASLRRSTLTAPEAVGPLPYCLHGSQSAWVVGPRLVRRFANVGLSAW